MAPDGTLPVADIRQLLSEAPEACTKPCTREACGTSCALPKTLPLLTDELLRELGALPLIETVLAPVTRGVTIETSDGKTALTLAVKPSKITRGSALVAIKRF